MSDKWKICPVCHGDGKHVNPNIDDNGLTAEDFYDDPSFAEDYFGGVYDVQCRTCNGSGKVLTADNVEETLRENAADRRMAALENGDYDAYCGASDWRHG